MFHRLQIYKKKDNFPFSSIMGMFCVLEKEFFELFRTPVYVVFGDPRRDIVAPRRFIYFPRATGSLYFDKRNVTAEIFLCVILVDVLCKWCIFRDGN